MNGIAFSLCSKPEEFARFDIADMQEPVADRHGQVFIGRSQHEWLDDMSGRSECPAFRLQYRLRDIRTETFRLILIKMSA